MRPPEEVSPAADNDEGHQTTESDQIRTAQFTRFDDFAARGRRRAAAVRLAGGDPDNPGARYQRPSTGLRASGFREGYERCAAAVADDLRHLYKQMQPGPE